MQTPLLHTWPTPHGVPHAPQWFWFCMKSTQTSPLLVSQRLKPPWQAQTPFAHPFELGGHFLPQLPQLLLLFWVSTQKFLQRSGAFPGHVHAELVHDAFCAQVTPQPPQFLVSTAVFTQTPLHAASEAGQVHAPARQFAPTAQALLHEPQLFRSVCSLTHVPLHDDAPTLHRQAPATQVPAPHDFPQLPQLFASLIVSTQTPLQAVSWMFVQPHLPLTHVAPCAQTLLHEPQFFESVVGLTQVDPQRTSPGAQPQVPLAQPRPAAQALPHAPQFFGSALRSMQTAPHSVVPPMQFLPHTPFEQNSSAAQAVPHDPQFLRSLWRLTQPLGQSVSPTPQPASLASPASSPASAPPTLPLMPPVPLPPCPLLVEVLVGVLPDAATVNSSPLQATTAVRSAADAAKRAHDWRRIRAALRENRLAVRVFMRPPRKSGPWGGSDGVQLDLGGSSRAGNVLRG